MHGLGSHCSRGPRVLMPKAAHCDRQYHKPASLVVPCAGMKSAVHPPSQHVVHASEVQSWLPAP